MLFRSLIIMLAALTGGISGASALELKDITFNTEGAGKVVFSHKVHLNKTTDVSCKTCHTTAGKKSMARVTMADMERGKSCGACHTGKKAFSLSKCTGCHKVKEITYQIKQTGPVLFSHTKHLKKMQCNACHNKLYATGSNRRVSMAEMEKGKSCGACHDAKKAFAISQCGKCHPTREVVFQVKATGPTVFSHKKHLAMYSCSACHTKIYAIGANKPVSMAAMEKGKSCGACHNAKEAFSVSKCGKCHPTRDIKFKVAKIADVKFSHATHLEIYKCSDCHTGTFPLRTGNKPVSMSEMKKSKSCGACHDGKVAFTVSGSCDTCHVR